jgi:hypothetical protein
MYMMRGCDLRLATFGAAIWWILDGMVQSISCPSEGEARKRLHGEDCAESFGIQKPQ